MPQIGWFEILLIIMIAIVVIGPKDFPVMLKKIGSVFGSIKRYINNFQNEISEIEETSKIDKDIDQENSKKKED